MSRLRRALFGPARVEAAPDPQLALKMQAFAALMRHRGDADGAEMAGVVNSIPALFADDPLIAVSQGDYVTARQRPASPRVQAGLLVELIAAVVLHLDLAGEVSVEDIRDFEPPEAVPPQAEALVEMKEDGAAATAPAAEEGFAEAEGPGVVTPEALDPPAPPAADRIEDADPASPLPSDAPLGVHAAKQPVADAPEVVREALVAPCGEPSRPEPDVAAVEAPRQGARPLPQLEPETPAPAGGLHEGPDPSPPCEALVEPVRTAPRTLQAVHAYLDDLERSWAEQTRLAA
jgi:hypothetical protein